MWIILVDGEWLGEVGQFETEEEAYIYASENFSERGIEEFEVEEDDY